MIDLKDLTDETKSKHLLLLTSRFSESFPKAPLVGNVAYPAYVDDLLRHLRDNLKTILSGTPQELMTIVEGIKNDYPDFHAHAQLKRSSKAWKSNPQSTAAVTLVEQCFDYDRFSKKTTSWGAYALVEAVSARVCPYCQLHHVNYHMPSGKKTFSLRPPLDHYLPRSNYPYLAVSLSNLIPCCAQCNSGVKLALDPIGLGLGHPRVTPANGRIRFSALGSIPCAIGGKTSDVKLEIIPSDAETGAHIEAFKLKDRYQWYAREIFALMQNHSRFMEYPKTVRDSVWRDEFVLGFPPDAASDRALGICLLDVFTELESGSIA